MNKINYYQWGSPHSLTDDGRIIVWFSCGAASACLAKLMVPLGATVLHCDTRGDEHPDNTRFLQDVQDWIGLPIESIRNTEYAGIDDVFKKHRYMAGISGARCTVELKKKPRIDMQRPTDVHCFGYTANETKRARRMEQGNPELRLNWGLIDAGLSKDDCHLMLRKAGIKLPVMYQLGFQNNNCIGCVKATSPKYWNLVRKHFPEKFQERAETSQELGVRLCRYKGKRIFLSDLPDDAQEDFFEELSCGPHCAPQQS